MSNQSRKPFIVRTGEHAGKVVIRIRMIPKLSSHPEQRFACYEINLLTRDVLEANQYDLDKSNLCQLVVQDDVFTDIDKKAEEIRERLNPRHRRVAKSKK
ncbi:hypothetical protein MPER_13162 [Moniliophthora perniciosa FA553]|nr:hypothetical protein MPER_13162 [Moniliophthora perniciosa FA553]